MGGASAHRESVDAETLQVFLYKVAEQVFAYLTDHPYLTPQASQADGSVGCASSGAQLVSINQPQFARRWQRINRAGKDVSN